ncbi:YeeE/YedE family protein [Xanthomonas maliensis]|uniref:YeeE/YedE family protein n=1 Tax=Xanthomonas maliensis TaxID=1321368 RepID=UPI0003A6CCFF|nr:YeeE/YedE family protein [Xanthomonas maliensis]KAB7770110.1 YeeE/YedE family protein [Xanthomonas maliensis]
MNAWLASTSGGVLIGLSATLLLLNNGRVAGVSGIVNGAMTAQRHDLAWRLAFLLGMISVAGVAMTLIADAPLPRQGFPPAALVLSGLLVGIGTRMGNGCTSGHGVCGLGRRSPRSLAAVVTFLVTAMITSFLVRHVWNIA